MKLSLYEQETILLYNQAEDTADVYTHDPKLFFNGICTPKSEEGA